MKLLNKLTIKNLKLNKKRTIVTIIGIMLSVALITAVISMYINGLNSLVTFEKIQQGDFHLYLREVDKEDISKFENNRKIEKVLTVNDIGYANIESNNTYKPYVFIKGMNNDSLESLSIKLIEGRLPKNDSEIIIPTHLKTNGRVEYKVGDKLALEVGDRISDDGAYLNQDDPFIYDEENDKALESITNIEKKEYTIVGIMERPANNLESYSAPGYTIVTYEENVNDKVDVYIKYSKDGIKDAYRLTGEIIGIDPDLFEKFAKGESITPEDEEKLAEQEANIKYVYGFNEYLIGLETDPLGTTGVGSLILVVFVVCLIIVVTSIFCIKNSFDISITEKVKQYGMLRSIGATKKQIRSNVFYEATILGLIGIPLGILLGLLASYILVFVCNYFLKDALSEGLKFIFVFSFIPLLFAIVLGVVTIYFSAFRSAFKASKISPIDSLRNSANIKITSKNVKMPKYISKIFGIGGEISYKNMKRNKSKYRTTIISIIFSVFVFIALNTFMNVAFDIVDMDLKSNDYNVSLRANFNKDEKDFYKDFISTTRLDNIDNYTIAREENLYIENPKINKEYLDLSNAIEISGEYISIYSLGDYQYKKYIKSLGLDYDDIKDKGILVTYMPVRYEEDKKTKVKYTNLFDYEVNDKIEGQCLDDQKCSFEIGYVSNDKPFGFKNMDGAFLFISDELYDKYFDTWNAIIYFESSDADKLQDDIEEVLKNKKYFLNNSNEQYRMINNLLILVAIFLYGFIIVITLIGVTNVFNTITTSMNLRRQEFAMLRSIGMTKKEFNRMIRLESLFVGLKSLLWGIPIGICLSYLIYRLVSEDIGLPYRLPIVAILISIVAVFILITSLMKYSMSKISKQNTIETIRNENI